MIRGRDLLVILVVIVGLGVVHLQGQPHKQQAAQQQKGQTVATVDRSKAGGQGSVLGASTTGNTNPVAPPIVHATIKKSVSASAAQPVTPTGTPITSIAEDPSARYSPNTNPPNDPIADKNAGADDSTQPVTTNPPLPNGGYPDKWAAPAKDTVIDDWGMYNRESVSYTAFKVHTDFLAGKNAVDMPNWGGTSGDAKYWPANAIAMSLPVDSTPLPGAIAVLTTGPVGHTMYIEKVNADGTINVSQYNFDNAGQYSERENMSTTGLTFIHFTNTKQQYSTF